MAKKSSSSKAPAKKVVKPPRTTDLRAKKAGNVKGGLVRLRRTY